ncbi:Gp138 family membrane-puncturing spike protein [Lysinibacillus capsici]|uniref:Gp138 family membrane-puncturing spike protein n=1 Tax=Lysinibacillus capsici TaxID=2115968 RepID=UPI0028AA6560|nr:Gp138 family membrane-puncturing spike protein [Lysinibacillus capsici]
MSNASAFFGGLMGGALVGINTAMPCKVLSFDASTCTAKIQPLFKAKEIDKEPKSLPPIEGVPVLFQRYRVHDNRKIVIATDKGAHGQSTGTGEHVHNELTFTESVEMIPDLIAGDVVLAVFCQRAIDEAQRGSDVYPGTARMFSIHDAVVVGVFKQ